MRTKKVTLITDNQKMVKRDDLLDYLINKQTYSETQHLDENLINTLYDKLYTLTKIDDLHKRQYIENINKKVKDINEIDKSNKFDEINNIENSKICPKCGGNLVKRVAKKRSHLGEEFYGCENFPKCRFIERIENN